MAATITLKELGLAALLVTLVSGATVDDSLSAEHRGGDDGGIPLGPEILEPAADPATDSDIEMELEIQLRDSLPPGLLARPPPQPTGLGIQLRGSLPPGYLARPSQQPAGLGIQLRGSLPPGLLVRPPQQPLRYQPLYAAAWPPYPAPYLFPGVYSVGAGPVGPPVPWYLAAVRGQRPFRYAGLVRADQPAPSVAASKIYDVTISSAHAPQLEE